MGLDKVRIQFNFTVKKVSRLPERMNGSTVYIMWRRGSKQNSGMTKRALVKDAEAVWSETISFVCSLFKDDENDQFENKTISFALKEVSLLLLLLFEFK